MTNPNPTSCEVAQAGAGRRRFRPFVKVTFATFIAILGVGFFATPAFAHSNIVTGTPSCPTGATQTISWEIANDYNLTEVANDFTTSVTGATFSASSVNIALTPSGTPVSGYSFATVVETIPATDTGVVSFSETGTWSDGHQQTLTANVTLGVGCTAPNIVVTKSVNTSTANNTVAAGSTTPVVYTLAIDNSGQEPTTSVVTVTDAIPADTTYVPGSASCGSTPSCVATEGSGTVTFTVQAPIYGGVTDDVSFSVTVDALAPAGSIPNTASYTGSCTPVAPATTCTTNTVTITVIIPVVISVIKSENVTAVTAGQTAPVIYTLTVKNPAASSLSTQQNVTVTDVVPSGLTFVSASCGALTATSSPTCTSSYDSSTRTVSYTLGTGIAPGASFPVTFQATVDATDTASIVNSAAYTGPGCVPGTGSTTCPTNTVTITVANFTVSKSDSAGSSTVNPGDVVTYTLTAHNTGTGPGSITVDDSAPTGTTLTTPAAACPANTASTCAVTVTGSDVSWVITNLPAGSSYDLTFAVKVNAGTGGTNILNTGVYTEPGCTTAGGCSTNTTTNPVPPPTSSNHSTTTTTTPVTTVKTAADGGVITGASSVHTGEPWAGSTPYVVAILIAGLSLFGVGQIRRRRRAAQEPTA